MKNILGIEVTKPNHELIVMRGVPSAGKSTKARQLVGDKGIIHSTDILIEETGSYRLFFEEMIAKNDFSSLNRMHKLNYKNFEYSMYKEISPIIIDNTNIKPWEPKEYIMYALNNGYADENIKIIDVGDGGLTAEQLFERNLHGVPMDKIRSMIDSHKAHSPLTLEKIINSKSPHDRVLYSAVVLDEESRDKLLNYCGVQNFGNHVKIYARHMTICFGKGLPENLKEDLGKEITLIVKQFGTSKTNIALGVDGYYSENKIPHITVATMFEGKPAMSNEIFDWIPIIDQVIELKGIIKEIRSN